jgi:hypothetical protein
VPTTAATISEMISGATERRRVQPEDARSGATFETLRLEGEPRFLKVVAHEADWIMRVTGNTDHWEYKVWQAGVYDRFPPSLDHTIVAMSLEANGPDARLGILMFDCSEDLIAPGDDLIEDAIHSAFVDHMADLHAAFWGWTDELGLCPMQNRFRFFAPEVIAPELEVDDVPPPVAAARCPELFELVRDLHHHPSGLLDPLATTPVTFLSGDWKMGNLGHRPDGRTILVDQAYPGSGPGCWDLMWYLALNRQRLPESKEQSIERYRAALEKRGIDTAGWWDAQLALCSLALIACFGWEKALGDDEELTWWERRSLAARAHLR